MDKRCSKCERDLLATVVYFYRHKNMKDGLNATCKECEGHRFKEPRKTPISLKEGYKICTKCRCELPETLEYFFKRKNGKNGLMSDCKVCHGFKYMKNITYNDKVKKCPSCKEIYPYTSEYFNRSGYTKSGLMATCKKCIQKNGKKHYINNKEIIDSKHRKYYEENKEAITIRGKKYRLLNPDKARMVWQTRAARRKQLPHTFTQKEWAECKKHFGDCCAYCGSAYSLEQEHFIPLKSGGEYTKANIIPSCKSCNSSKQDKLFSQWYHKQKFYNKKREKKISEYLGYSKGIQQTALL